MDADEQAEQDAFDAEVVLPAITPHVLAAVDAGARRDLPGIGAAWRAILPLGERAVFMALTALSEMAVLGIQLPPGADGFMPMITKRGEGVVDPDLPEHAAPAFVGRFCAAAITKDRALQMDLMAALLDTVAPDAPDMAAEERVADAFAMLTQVAAEGVAREQRRRARVGQHPKASRNSHPHRRDQRKR